MSTLAYGTLTSKREEAEPDTSSDTSPGVKTYIDAFAALVPAEVLAAHALILSATTGAPEGAAATTSGTVITETNTLKGAFIALIIVSMALYLLGRRKNLDRWDVLRVLIPPLAFVGWTMLQPTTAFDAVWPSLGKAPRVVSAVIGALILGPIAAALAYKADQTPKAD